MAIHCGDLTIESKLDEFESAIRLLERIDAPLKLTIAGNHDFALDTPMFKNKVAEAHEPLDSELVRRVYGDYEETRSMFDNSGVILLDEGTHHFTLQNGASLTVYTSPYTPSFGDWGFQYHPEQGHEFAISSNVDVAITHGPPNGIMDYANGQRAGSSDLFEAVARARPCMHFFGHIYEGWGAKLAAWRKMVSEKPSYMTDIDNENSTVVGRLADIVQENAHRTSYQTSHCSNDSHPIQHSAHTLFVNSAIEGSTDEYSVQPPWLIDLELPRAG